MYLPTVKLRHRDVKFVGTLDSASKWYCADMQSQPTLPSIRRFRHSWDKLSFISDYFKKYQYFN